MILWIDPITVGAFVWYLNVKNSSLAYANIFLSDRELTQVNWKIVYVIAKYKDVVVVPSDSLGIL